MTRRARKFDIGFMRNRITFYSQSATSTAHGTTLNYTPIITRFASKDTNNQSQFYALIAGANMNTQSVVFYTRQHPTFFPSKDLFVKNENDSKWYKVLSCQPLEDPQAYYRIVCEETTIIPSAGDIAYQNTLNSTLDFTL